MEYTEYTTHAHLARFVECFWSAYSEKPPFRERERLIPDGTIELLFNFGDNYSQILENGIRPVKGSHFIGIRKQALIISQTRQQNFFCIRFRPGGTYPFFRMPVHLFANGFFTVEELLDYEFRQLEDQLAHARSNAERVKLTNDFLLRCLDRIPDDYLFVGSFAREYLGGNVPIQKLADQYGTTYKTLERKFRKVIGLTPSELYGIKRFNRAVLAMYSCRYGSLTGVAYESGYYDQSHFIRDFRQLTGLTPRQFLQEQYTIVQVIQPALAKRLSKSYNF